MSDLVKIFAVGCAGGLLTFCLAWWLTRGRAAQLSAAAEARLLNLLRDNPDIRGSVRSRRTEPLTTPPAALPDTRRETRAPGGGYGALVRKSRVGTPDVRRVEAFTTVQAPPVTDDAPTRIYPASLKHVAVRPTSPAEPVSLATRRSSRTAARPGANAPTYVGMGEKKNG